LGTRSGRARRFAWNATGIRAEQSVSENFLEDILEEEGDERMSESKKHEKSVEQDGLACVTRKY
jgi:hypothetical protein